MSLLPREIAGCWKDRSGNAMQEPRGLLELQEKQKIPEEYFPDSTTRVWRKCDNGHSFRAPIREMVLRWRCPKCERKRNAPWRK